MFRNYLVTALRNLARNWLYASISIFGLAVAFAGAILIAQFVRNEFTYDRWIPDYQHIYTITTDFRAPGQPDSNSDMSQAQVTKQLKLVYPDTVAMARTDQDFPTIHQKPGDDGIVDQTFSWADPDIFKVFPLPALAGDPNTALSQPDTVVMTRRMARVYFGTDLPIGKMLDVQQDKDHHPMRVTAILRDYPSNTSLVTEIFASGLSSYSNFHFQDAHPSLGGIGSHAFVRIKPTSSGEALQRALDIAGKPEIDYWQAVGSTKFRFGAQPFSQTHLISHSIADIVVKPVGSRATALAIATVGLLIVLVAAINFVTLMTARATRRATEVGIRKVNGASRGDLIVQFLGEALIYAVLSMLIATGLAALAFKPFSAFVQRGLSLDFIHDPALAGGLLLATLAIGLLGGAYPALVLSSFKPAMVLKGGLIQTAGSQTARQALVVAQFAILIGLILSTVTIYRQTQYALNQGMGAKRDLIIQVFGGCASSAFPDEVRKLRGVAAAACSSQNALNVPFASNVTIAQTVDHRPIQINLAPVDFGFFEVYGIKPLAGRLFDRAYGADGVLLQPGVVPGPPPPGAPPSDTPPPPVTVQPPVLINATAARDLGFASPAAAIGKPFVWRQFRGGENAGMKPSEILGVVPDMPTTVQGGVDPTFYFIVPRLGMMSIRTTGADMPGTVRDIERIWKATDNDHPIEEIFLSQYRRTQYLDIIIQGATIAICAAAAIVIACLGLFALSAYTTERRTKEIGIRKVMGASTFDVVRLLVGQFTVPVLWAILIACPLGYLLMDHWLKGFASHVSLPLWSLAAAAGVALIVAWLTVSFQSFKAARAKPILALRYE
jgi:putative ABC transport system permease protein